MMRFVALFVLLWFGMSCESRNPFEGDTAKRFVNSVGIEFVYLPPGIYTMGSPVTEDDEYGCRIAETQHKVAIASPMWMSSTEVTNRQYAGFDPTYAKYPVAEPALVSWHDAVKFCEWLSKKEGRLYRLPLEREWEYACRAGTQTPWSCGDDPVALREHAVCASPDPTVPARTKPERVASKRANPWGLHDLHGNVAEWCSETPYLYDSADPLNRVDGLPPRNAWPQYRIIRGGAYMGHPMSLRSASRNMIKANQQEAGIRLICQPSIKD